MALFLKVLVFVLFLACYTGFLLLARLAGRWIGRHALSAGVSFGQGLVMAIGTSGAVTLFLFLLARFFDPWLTLSLLLVGIGVQVLTLAIRSLMGSREAEVEYLWESFGWGARSQRAATVLNLIGVAIVVAYPIAAGVVYFTSPIPSPEATVWILRLTLLGLLLGAQLGPILLGASLLMAETLEDDARSMLLAQRLLGVTATAFLIALAFWAFRIVEEEGELGITTVVTGFAPLLAIFLVLYFIVTSLVPYLIGYRQSTRWRRSFLREEDRLRARLLDALEVPSTETKLEALHNVAAATEDELARWEGDRVVTLTKLMEEGDLGIAIPEDYAPMLKLLSDANVDFRRNDPRFHHLAWLQEFRERVGNIAEEMERKRSKAAVAKVSEEWAGYFRAKEEEGLADGRRPTQPTKSLATVVVSFLVSSGLLGLILSETAKIVSRSITRAGP